ncbi:MAG: helix-turn-helix domain-containing protein [Leptospiraceae bacterium]|nr:helix-turn-helix domain-containing protein [Leptospiraceae bacterium]
MIEILHDVKLDSTFVEKITHGYSINELRTIRPAETSSHIVISKRHDKSEVFLVGPCSAASPIVIGADAEMIWIRLNLGTQMSAIPTSKFTNKENLLPNLNSSEIIVNDSILKIPDYNDIDGFLDKLKRIGFFKYNSMIPDVIAGAKAKIPARTLRKHFLDVAGLSQERVRQIQKAEQAKTMLLSGVPILDVVDKLGYYDQAHLTGNLKKQIGKTPGELKKSLELPNLPRQ